MKPTRTRYLVAAAVVCAWQAPRWQIGLAESVLHDKATHVFAIAPAASTPEFLPVRAAGKAYDNKCTGKIGKVRIDLQEMKSADKEEAEKAQHEVAVESGVRLVQAGSPSAISSTSP